MCGAVSFELLLGETEGETVREVGDANHDDSGNCGGESGGGNGDEDGHDAPFRGVGVLLNPL